MSESFNINNTLGAAFIGGLLATALFGVTCTQTFHYYQESLEDPWLLKALVGFILLCDIADIILIAKGLYWYMITNFSNPEILTLISSSLSASIVVSTVSDTLIRIFFARRIWIMSLKSYIIILPLACLTILIFVGGIGLGVTALDAVTYKQEESQYWLARTILTLMVASDFYIAICLSLLLYRARTRTTNSIIPNLILYSISTGLLTAVTSTLCLVTLITLPASYIWIGIHLPLSKFYCNAMLAAINSRKGFRSTIRLSATDENAGGFRIVPRNGISESIESRSYPLVIRSDSTTPSSPSRYSGKITTVARFPDIKIRPDVSALTV